MQKTKIDQCDWDICYTPGIVKMLPAIFWHREKRLLEFGWLTWSFVIRLN